MLGPPGLNENRYFGLAKGSAHGEAARLASVERADKTTEGSSRACSRSTIRLPVGELRLNTAQGSLRCEAIIGRPAVFF